MKKIIFCGVDPGPVNEYQRQIQDFFGSRAAVDGIAVDRIGAKMDADLIVASSELVKNLIMSKLSGWDGSRIVVLKSLFSTSQLKAISKASRQKALIVGYYRSYVKESMVLIEASLDRKVNLIPYYENVKHKVYKTYENAIFIGEDRLIPHGAKHIVNIGWRRVSHYTFIQIIEKLDMVCSELQRKIETCQQMMPPLSFEKLQAIQLMAETSKTFDKLFDSVVDKGVVLLDYNDRIIDYNEYVCNLFDIKRDVFVDKKILETDRLNEVYDGIKNARDDIPVDIRAGKLHLTVTRKTVRFQHLAYQTFILLERQKSSAAKNRIKAKYKFKDIISVSRHMKQCIRIAGKAAGIESPVLIMGETGTGKEMFAQAVHNASPRKNKPFIALNCTTLQESLLTSELFGYEKGTFTGALSQGKKGIFEIADGGTVFLDEIGDAPLNVQVELLRVLEEKEIRRIGGEQMIPVNVRIISATNRNLYDSIEKERFRKDLYYRLSAFVIEIPPLRERSHDIKLLTDNFLKQQGYFYKKINPDVYQNMEKLNWEGNIRELKNFVSYMGYMSEEVITNRHIPENYKKLLNTKLIPEKSETYFPDLDLRTNAAAVEVLRALKYGSKGRRTLAGQLNQPGLPISDYDVRNVLTYLNTLGYVVSGRGRKGSAITEKGLLFLNSLTGEKRR